MTNDVEMTMWSHALFNILHVPMNNKQLRKKIACSSLNESIWLTNPEILEQRKHGLHSSKQHSIRCVWRNNSSLGKTNLYKKKSNLNIYICMYVFILSWVQLPLWAIRRLVKPTIQLHFESWRIDSPYI